MPEGLAKSLPALKRLSEAHSILIASYGHAGDGNFHVNVLWDEDALDPHPAVEAVLRAAVDLGGTITGEHGVGVEKINEMCAQFRDEELALFHAVKRAFDPAGLLNPGKAVPTLARCAEFGHRHVHAAAAAAHPGLPRF